MVSPDPLQGKSIAQSLPTPTSCRCVACERPTTPHNPHLVILGTSHTSKHPDPVNAPGDFDLLRHQNDISDRRKMVGPSTCHCSGVGGVIIERVTSSGQTRGNPNGLLYCGTSSCWWCSRKHARRESEKWLRIMRKGERLAYSLVNATLTVRSNYKGGVALANVATRDVLYKAWSQPSNARWRRSRKWDDYLRALEVNMNLNGKAHPHLNAVLLCRSDVDVRALEAELTVRWRQLVKRLSPDHAPSLDHGVKLRLIEGDEDMQRTAGYDTKLGVKEATALECLASENKVGTGYHVGELLAMSYAGDERATRAFRLWQALVKGKRRYQLSQALEDRLDDELRARGVDPDEFGEREREVTREPVALVGTRGVRIIHRLRLWQAILYKVGSYSSSDCDRWLVRMCELHLDGRLSDGDFASSLRLWLARIPDGGT